MLSFSLFRKGNNACLGFGRKSGTRLYIFCAITQISDVLDYENYKVSDKKEFHSLMLIRHIVHNPAIFHRAFSFVRNANHMGNDRRTLLLFLPPKYSPLVSFFSSPD